MATIPRQEPATVSCPYCERETTVSVPDDVGADVDLEVRRSVALYGEHTTVVCSADHEFWVYFC
ncbi:hypothetical protein OB955_08530 [Halobacteria archaeon AArc-m2/3/4]|uniref:Uncharacterized protein n=1 Tax=Natronoglomus mannanivorans TaxID=2979990 RepID=A0AAP2YX20_9EURY|nr:hypothetical protein [Halobacteria archaeon AArc-xg1-1]MCU4972784.1 hypothetical protein [Halobacteria archaeon AArc-m2/3/4]